MATIRSYAKPNERGELEYFVDQADLEQQLARERSQVEAFFARLRDSHGRKPSEDSPAGQLIRRFRDGRH